VQENNKPESKIIRFDKCPNCGSKKRFASDMAQTVKDRGLMRMELEFWENIWQGVVRDVDPRQEAKVPFGTKVPTFYVCVTVCSDCGTIYAGKMVEDTTTKQLPQATAPTDKLINPISSS